MPRYIDADEVKKAIEESWDGCLGSYDSHEITMNDLWVIDKVQTADVRENVHAHWVFSPSHSEGICTNCNYKIYGRPYQNTYLIVPYNFCPNCGAQMDERREDAEIH